MKRLSEIQHKLKAPKNQKNTFGNYFYRSCEDILEAVKPLLGDLILTLSDEIIEIGGRFYVKATATLKDGDNAIATIAYAREEETKKGMDASQITGSASSYARKRSLEGMFLLDDTRDSDVTNKDEPSESFDKWKIKVSELSESSADEIKNWWIMHNEEVKSELSKADAAKIYDDLVKLKKSKEKSDGNNS